MTLSLVGSSALLRALCHTALLLAISSTLLLVLISLHLRRSLHRSCPSQRAHLFRSLGLTDYPDTLVVGFFHPYCNAGGGGERVLWTAISAMQRDDKDAVFVVYTGDVGTDKGKGQVSKEDILEKVKARFNISLSPSTLHFVPLTLRHLVHDSTWRRFTLVGQSLGSVVLAYEGLRGREGVVPDVWIDTMGYAFAYPLVRYLCNIPVGSYTHYPTISTDMLHRIRTRQAGHTNPARVANSWVLSKAKLAYYTLFTALYSFSLSRASLIMVNSTWTSRHIESLLSPPSSSSSSTPEKKKKNRTRIVYPPCDTSSLASLPLSTSHRLSLSQGRTTIFSLAQFRPEKEHAVQLRAFSLLLAASPDLRGTVRLVLAGSVRGVEDEARVEALKKLAGELGLREGEGEEVQFVVNAVWEEIKGWMGRSSVGLHTMVDEHFGIGVVEFQAAGLIPLAHASAGPLLDILVPFPSSPQSSSSSPPLPTGFLARPSPPSLSAQEAFASQLLHILSLPVAEQDALRRRARESATERFSVGVLERGWSGGWGVLRGEAMAQRRAGGEKRGREKEL